MKYPNITKEELFIKKCIKVSNKNLTKKAIEQDFYNYLRLNPIFTSKEAVIPGINNYYNRYLTAESLNKAYNCYRVAANKVNAKVKDSSLSNMKNAYNRYHQVKLLFIEKEKIVEEKKVSFKQMADIFEASIGAIYLSYGLQCCYTYLDFTKIIKLNKIGQSIPNEVKDNKLEDELYKKHKMIAVEDTILKYRFRNKAHLILALLHNSSLDKYSANITRYREYGILGRTVIKMLVVTYLYFKHPSALPGLLTELKFAGSSKSLLAFIALQTKLYNYFICNNAQLLKDILQSNNQIVESKENLEVIDSACAKELANLVEEIVGAVYIDVGQDVRKVSEVIMPLLKPYLDVYATLEYCKEHRQPKAALTELLTNNGFSYAEDVKVDIRMKSDGRKFVYQGYFKEILIEEAESNSNSKAVKMKFMKMMYEKTKSILRDLADQTKSSLKEIIKDYEAKGTKNIN